MCCFLLCTGFLIRTNAQIAKMGEFPVLELLINSDTVFRGKVLSSSAAWEADGNIYTTFQLEIGAWYKGASKRRIYTLKQRGGIVGDVGQIGTHLADFQKNEEVVLFIKNGGVWAGEAGKFAIQEGYVMEEKLALPDFDQMMKQIVSAPETQLQNIHQQFNGKRVDVNEKLNKSLAVAISSFSPTTATGGTGSMVTINGSGFGATQGAGKVEFTKQANSAGTTSEWQQAEIVSWSDTVIRVLVPAGASSGKI
jgi:hypothetical protein